MNFIIVVIFAILFSSCSSSYSNYCITALDCDEGQICEDGKCVDKKSEGGGDSGNSGNTTDAGNSGNSGNTGNSGDTIKDLCDPNPCIGIPLSDETCSSDGENYSCGCIEGYYWFEESCVDIDECEDEILNNCSEFADCTNTTGGYECSCRENYSGDGFECTADTKIVDCENSFPENGKWSESNSDGKLTQTWNGAD